MVLPNDIMCIGHEAGQGEVMDNLKDERDFTVALLIDDIKHAKEVSEALREMGIFAHVYQALEDFWVATNTHTPDLAIIDVKCMSQGNLLLRNHPKIKEGSIHYCFLYKTSTKPLLNSTRGLQHFGLINMDVELSTQIQTTLYARNRQLEVEAKNKKLSERVDRLQKRSARIMAEVQDSYNFENQFQKLENLIERMGTLKGSDNFVTRVSTILEMWDECSRYAIYEVNQTGQKLVSPKVNRTKYKELPDLWLTRECHQGMESFAVEMAEEVAYDLFDCPVRVLRVQGAHENPDLIIVGAFNEEKLADFQWKWLERYLNGMYTQLALRKQMAIVPEVHELTTSECLNYLDDLHFHHAKAAHKIFQINFAPLLDWINGNSSNRFFWKAFHSDYVHQLANFLSGNFKVSHYGAHSYVVMVDLKYLEKDFNALRHFVSEFAYWRYFEDSSIVMQKNVIPQIKTLAPSAVSLMRSVQGQTQKVQELGSLRRGEGSAAFRGIDIP